MKEREVTVVLESLDGIATQRNGIVVEFTPADRVRRALGVFGAGLLLAALLIPIPIIHLLGIPMALIAGGVLAVKQLSRVARLRPTRLACPKCGGMNRVGGGLGVRDPGAAIERNCDECRRGLVLRIGDRDPELRAGAAAPSP